MKASQQKILSSIRHQMNFIISFELLEVYLQELYLTLSFSSPNAKQRSLNQLTLQEYLDYPLYISAKLFNGLTNAGSLLSEFDFVSQLMSLYMGDFNIILSILSKVLDFQSKGVIHKADVQLLFELFDYQHIDSIKDMLDASFKDNAQLSIEEFQARMNVEGDLIVLFFMYLLADAPFEKEEVEYFNTLCDCKELGNRKRYSMYNCCGNLLKNIEMNREQSIGLSQGFIDFLKERFNVDLADAMDNADEDLNELAEFESEVTKVISNSSMNTNTPVKLPHLSSMNLGLISNNNTIHEEESLTHISDSTIILYNFPTSLTNLTNERRALSTQNSPIQCLHHHKPYIFTTGKTRHPSSFLFSHKPNQLTQCKLTILNCTLYIEKHCRNVNSSGKSPQTFPLIHANNYNNNNNPKLNNCSVNCISVSLNNDNDIDNNPNNNYNESTNNITNHDTNDGLCFKYSRLFSLKATSAVFLGEEVIDNEEYVKMKLVMRFNNQVKEITLYSKDMPKLKEFVALINFNAEVRNVKDDYLFDKELGKGSFSRVYLGFNRRTGEKAAIKEMQITMKSKEYSLMKNEWDIVKLLAKAPHESLVLPIDCYKTGTAHYFVFEYLEGITLRKYLESHAHKISLETKMEILRQIAEGIAFLHSRSIAHRDIKPENIIVLKASMNSSRPIVKIIDYGFAKILGKGETITNESLGTLVYIAPEILNKKEFNAQVDIWSFGVVMYQLLFNELPFGEHSDDLKEISNQILKNDYAFPTNTNIGTKHIAIIKQCLVPINRLSIDQLLLLLS